jgi:type IV pilus assembly protein PilA
MKQLIKRMNAKKNNKGFTLVELIIVIAIIAVLAAVLAPQYVKYVENSKVSVDENAMSEMAHTVEVVMADTAVYDTLPAGNFTVAYTDNANDVVVTGLTDSSKLAAAIKGVVTLPIDLKSKTHDGQKVTISVTYDGTNKTYKVGAPAYAAVPAQQG